jgi:hypothetical protein
MLYGLTQIAESSVKEIDSSAWVMLLKVHVFCICFIFAAFLKNPC